MHPVVFEDKMMTLASEAHLGQKYGDKPYTYHLKQVRDKVMELFREGGYLTPTDQDTKLKIIALGHDLLEDTSITSEELLDKGYSFSVVHAIESVTKVEGETYSEYITKVKSNPLALKVKVADTLCNLEESLKISDVKRINKYTKQLQKLYK